MPLTDCKDMAAAARGNTAIAMHAVTKRFATPAGSFTALDAVNLTIASGEFVAIVGKSGSGKSTLINMIAGIDRPTCGEVMVAGSRIDDVRESDLAKFRGRTIGIVFQFFQLLPTLTIAENVMLPMDFCAVYPPARRAARARELLDRVGVAEQADKFPTALSGGQQQRAAIARALANDPAIIVADEPTGNLDSRTAEAVIALFCDLARSGKTVALVTHERDIARVVDRTVTLTDGRIATDIVGRRRGDSHTIKELDA
ncbi:MAG: ABC transporter ATP-binding protein [Proteobacteria bacterium]|nr:ABC transporter ATP-binding protein [Pseudomonadota bacterium]